jgi:hypothetical protein
MVKGQHAGVPRRKRKHGLVMDTEIEMIIFVRPSTRNPRPKEIALLVINLNCG